MERYFWVVTTQEDWILKDKDKSKTGTMKGEQGSSHYFRKQSGTWRKKRNLQPMVRDHETPRDRKRKRTGCSLRGWVEGEQGGLASERGFCF